MSFDLNEPVPFSEGKGGKSRDELPFSLPSAASKSEKRALSPVLLDDSPPSSPLAQSSPIQTKKAPPTPESPFREKSSFLKKFELEFDDSSDDDLFLSSDEEESSQRAKRKRREREGSPGSRKKRKIEANEKSEEDGKIYLGKDGEGSSISIPSHVGSLLFPHQVEGVKFLFENYQKGRGCVLGDDMGLGKTVQVIAFLSAICQKTMRSAFQSACEDYKILIVVPASVISQWEKELAKFGLNTFKVCLYHGQTKRMALSKIKSGYADVMISSYGMVQKELDEMNGVEWTCVVFDEVHKLKDRTSKVCRACCQLECQKRYGLTGTLMQNNFEELWCLLDWASAFFFFFFFHLKYNLMFLFLGPGVVGVLEDFRRDFVEVIKTGQRHDASLPQIAMAKEAAQDLSRLLETGRVVLRRDKQIISHLLPKKKDHIVFCPLTPLQKRCYSRVIRSDDVVAIRKSQAPSDPSMCALFYMSKLTQLSSHLGLLRGASGQGMLSENDEKFLDLAFDDDLEEIQQLMKSPHVDDLCELSGKLRVVMKLLPVWRKEGHKVLLFSQSTRMLDIFEQVLSLRRYPFCRLDGTVSVTQRQRIADNFNKNPRMFVFLLSTKAAGLGLNLVSASVVVVFDPSWNQVSFFFLLLFSH